jgi:hypothetical protein
MSHVRILIFKQSSYQICKFRAVLILETSGSISYVTCHHDAKILYTMTPFVSNHKFRQLEHYLMYLFKFPMKHLTSVQSCQRLWKSFIQSKYSFFRYPYGCVMECAQSDSVTVVFKPVLLLLLAMLVIIK